MRPEDAETPQPDNADLLNIAMRAIVGPDNVLRGSLRAGVYRALVAVAPLIAARKLGARGYVPKEEHDMIGDDEDMKTAVAREIYRACEDLGAGPDLLSIIGSYGDTLDDADILSMLKTYNATGRALEWQKGDPVQ